MSASTTTIAPVARYLVMYLAINLAMYLAPSLFATPLLAKSPPARADGPPRLNVAPSCDAAARGAIVIGRDKEACMGDERTAQDTLNQNWSKYRAADKTQCIGNVRTGGPASYVELLSCLEIMRDAKSIREGDATAQQDNSGQSRRRRRH